MVPLREWELTRLASTPAVCDLIRFTAMLLSLPTLIQQIILFYIWSSCMALTLQENGFCDQNFATKRTISIFDRNSHFGYKILIAKIHLSCNVIRSHYLIKLVPLLHFLLFFCSHVLMLLLQHLN